MNRLLRMILPLLVVGALGGALPAAAGPAPPENVSGALASLGMSAPRERLSAPEFRLFTPDGAEGRLADYRGKLVVLNFWATWCGPCVTEMPALEAVWNTYREAGLVVLAINVDRGRLKAVRQFVARRGLSFPVLLDPTGETRKGYEVAALPVTYLIGRDGRFMGKSLGAREWNGAAQMAAFESLLAAP
ncbi:MAG: TlpA family protein disulfide reductase [Nitrospirota bacterium]|nr:TlpA family protein disulfide reductase [Nitrospirota bacterium]